MEQPPMKELHDLPNMAFKLYEDVLASRIKTSESDAVLAYGRGDDILCSILANQTIIMKTMRFMMSQMPVVQEFPDILGKG